MKGMTPKTSKMVMCNIRNVVSRKPGAFIINYHLQSIFYNPNGVCKGMSHPQDKQKCYKHEKTFKSDSTQNHNKIFLSDLCICQFLYM